MTEQQRLIYDLSLQCASIRVQRERRTDTSIEAQMLDAFRSSVEMYSFMDKSNFSDALAAIKGEWV